MQGRSTLSCHANSIFALSGVLSLVGLLGFAFSLTNLVNGNNSAQWQVILFGVLSSLSLFSTVGTGFLLLRNQTFLCSHRRDGVLRMGPTIVTLDDQVLSSCTVPMPCLN